MDVAASGVELVTSDAHRGWNAIAVVFAGASWQRCRTHFMANLLARVHPPEIVEGQAWPPWYAPSTSNCLPQRSTANWTEWWNNSGSLFPGGGTTGGRCAGHPGVHGLPSGPLAEAVVQQPTPTSLANIHVIG